MIIETLNPKMKGSGLWACKPQRGLCPMNCNQCFCNREGAAYVPLDEPYIPAPDVVGEGIVRINDLNDSNIERDEVIKTALKYRNFFFNTAVSKFDFPGPVVFTANREEEKPATLLQVPDNMMYIRLRVSPTNLNHVRKAVEFYTDNRVPVVLTLMAYYDMLPPGTFSAADIKDMRAVSIINSYSTMLAKPVINAFQWKVRHVNQYWSPTVEWARFVTQEMKKVGGRLVVYCGCYENHRSSNYCKDCLNCKLYYQQTIKHMKEQGWEYSQDEGWRLLCQKQDQDVSGAASS